MKVLTPSKHKKDQNPIPKHFRKRFYKKYEKQKPQNKKFYKRKFQRSNKTRILLVGNVKKHVIIQINAP